VCVCVFEGMARLQFALESGEIRWNQRHPHSIPVSLATGHSAVQQVIKPTDNRLCCVIGRLNPMQIFCQKILNFPYSI